MVFNIQKIQFKLPDAFTLDAFEKSTKYHFDVQVKQLQNIIKTIGTENTKFKKDYQIFLGKISKNKIISDIINTKYDIRLYAYFLSNAGKTHKDATNNIILNKIDDISPRPNLMLIEVISDYFFNNFKNNDCFNDIGKWIINARKKRKMPFINQEKIFSSEGPLWLAQKAFDNKCDFLFILNDFNLNQYRGSQYLQISQGYYYLETLKNISVDANHPVLNEMKNPDVYQSPFDDNLLGHKILEIMIERCPKNKIHEKWQEVILNIAGDPRVSKNNERFLKWWSFLDEALILKVKGWLSTLDIKLFLKAMEDYAKGSNNFEMQRMFPARKKFLEGLIKKEIVVDTRLFLSREMEKYLKRYYKKEELPNYSTVYDNDKSVIYIDLENAKIIEGSHSCYLWIFNNLKKSAHIFDMLQKEFSYHSLTSGLSYDYAYKSSVKDNKIVHNGQWQKRAVDSLRSLNVDIHIKDVLTQDDWHDYKRKFGVY